MEEKPPIDYALTIPGEYGHPIPRELMLRELGFNGPFSRHSVGKALVSGTLKTKAVHTMCTRSVLKKKNFKLPNGARTTFHLAFSPDGTKVASCHGDHNVYVSNIATLQVLKTLSGHPRTPWCVVFHPTQNDVIASGCLAGHVRVWDLNGGGSEVLVCDSGTVIASLSFHPTVRLLAIATFNEIIFWDWGLGPHPLARCSTGNTKEKVRLVRFDRLGHNLVTGITNFPNPPGSSGEAESSRNERCDGGESRSAFFRPNILSRTPASTQTGVRHGRIPISREEFVPVIRPVAYEDPESPSAMLVSMGEPASVSVSAVTQALNERQERFQESYRQLVNHYEDLVQHYQQFIRTRLGVPSSVVDFIPESDSDETSSETPSDSPPIDIDIVVSENPSIHINPQQTSQSNEISVDSPLVLLNDEIPRSSSSLTITPSSVMTPPSATTQPLSTNNPQAQPIPRTSSQGEQRNTSDLRSIQALEQNILEMQNLCSQARRDSSNFPVEPVHIQELRTIRRHLEVLQDQTRRLQSSIRETLSSLARGTGGFEALRGRLTSIIPGPTSRFTVENSFRRTSHENSTDIPTANETTPPTLSLDEIQPPSIPTLPISILEGGASSLLPETHATQNIDRIDRGRIRYLVGTWSSSRLGSQRVPPVVPMQYETPYFQTQNQSQNPTPPEQPPPNQRNQSVETAAAVARASYVAAGRLARELFMAEAVHDHSQFCVHETAVSRPPSRMRTISDLGEAPQLSVWPTIETGHERATRSFRMPLVNSRTIIPSLSTSTSTIQYSGMDRYNRGTGDFTSFGNWIGQGSSWINNDIGVRVYLTVRQFNERINTLRTERDQLLAQREQLLHRRARVQTALSRAERARDSDGTESWQRNFQSGVAVVPPCIREGTRILNIRRRGTRSTPTNNDPQSNISLCLGEEIPSISPNRSGGTLSNQTQSASVTPNLQPIDRMRFRREPPSRLSGFQRSTVIRVGDDFVPVYSLFRSRDIVHQNTYVFPIGLFLEGGGWNSNSIAIYWPPTTREEEESSIDFRRTENLIPILTTEAERLLDSRSSRYRIEYDSTQLTLHIGEGSSLNFIQPGLTILDAVSTMANFTRPRDNSGVVYIPHVAPFLDAIERIFGSHRRRERDQIPSRQIRLNTVLQPGPYNDNAPTGDYRSTQYLAQMRLRQLGAIEGVNRIRQMRSTQNSQESTTDSNQSQDVPSSTSGTQSAPSVSLHTAALSTPSVRLRRDLLRGWDRSASVYRQNRDNFEQRRTSNLPLNSHVIQQYFLPQTDEINRQVMQPTGQPDWRIVSGHQQQQSSGGDSMDLFSPQGVPPSEGDSDSASLASTRRVIRLAVAAAASQVLRRSQVPYSLPPNYFAEFGPNYDTNSTRAVESRIERVLNERGNRGLEISATNSTTLSPSSNNQNPSASTQTMLYSAWGYEGGEERNEESSTPVRSETSVGVGLMQETTVIFPERREDSGLNTLPNINIGIPEVQQPEIQFLRSTELRTSFIDSDEEDSDEELLVPRRFMRLNDNSGNNRVTSTEYLRSLSILDDPPLQLRRRPHHRVMSSTNRFPTTPSNPEYLRALRLRRQIQRRSGSAGRGAFRALNINESTIEDTDTGDNHSNLSSNSRPSETLGREYPSVSSRVEWVPRSSRWASAGRGTSLSVQHSIRRDPINPPAPPSGNPSSSGTGITSIGNFFHRVPQPTQDNTNHHQHLSQNSADSNDRNNLYSHGEQPIGARFYPGYIPEIVITPRAQPRNYYTLDASTTAFLSSRIQKWDFSRFVIPHIQSRDESVVVKECSLHSDACLDLSSDGDFVAVCIPSDSGSYSAIGLYSIRDESLGDVIHMFHFDQNTVSVSISPSCDYIVVGYAGRGGPFYRFVHQSRTIGQVVLLYRKIGKILTLSRDSEGEAKLVSVKELYTDSPTSMMSINCMHWVPVSGYGIVYGTNTGDLVLLS